MLSTHSSFLSVTKIVNDSKETLSNTVLSPGLLIIHANAQHWRSLYFTHANRAQGSMNNGNTQMTGKSDCKYCFQHVLSQAISKCLLLLLINILHPSEILGEVTGSKPGLICIPCSLCSPRTGRSNRQEMKRPRPATNRRHYLQPALTRASKAML